MANVTVAVVLAVRGQRVAHETQTGVGGNASELKTELLAGDVLVGIHVERGVSGEELKDMQMRQQLYPQEVSDEIILKAKEVRNMNDGYF